MTRYWVWPRTTPPQNGREVVAKSIDAARQVCARAWQLSEEDVFASTIGRRGVHPSSQRAEV